MIVKVVKEIGVVNDNSQNLNSCLNSDDYNILLVEHKRPTCFGTHYFGFVAKAFGSTTETI